jgi:hypothetical protein
MSTEGIKRAADYAAAGGGSVVSVGTLADVSAVAEQLSPILSCVFLLLSAGWLIYRMWVHYRTGEVIRDE